jgi:hypothetical protein
MFVAEQKRWKVFEAEEIGGRFYLFQDGRSVSGFSILFARQTVSGGETSKPAIRSKIHASDTLKRKARSVFKPLILF